jgi:hypothetical protein
MKFRGTKGISRRLPAFALLLCGAAGATAAGAQGAQVVPPAQMQGNSPQPTGSVSGRVMLSDTDRPARFAEVLLIPVQEASANGGDDRFANRGRRGSARTDLEGNYVVTSLPAGQYYATASATGYVSTMGAIAARASGSADVASLVAQLPQVSVTAGGVSTANLTLERGGVIAGKLLWDDGSPATGVQVSAVLSSAQSVLNQRRGPQGLGQFGFVVGGNFAQTDDRGNFRLTGLAPGDYLVRGNFAAPSPTLGASSGNPALQGFSGAGNFGRIISLALYAPGKMRKADAQVITLALGEERADVQFTADLRSLHNVAGRVSSASDTAVHSGSVRLVDSQDSTLTRNTQIDPDGSFTVPYVPMGTYTLSIYASSATQGSQGRGRGQTNTPPAVSFQPVQETLTVTDADIAGVNVTVVPVTTGSGSSSTGSR